MIPTRDVRRRGVALFVVLVFAALITGLAGTAMRGSSSGVRAAGVYLDQMRADALGRSAADIVSYYVLRGSPERRRGGSLEVRIGEEAVLSVTYLSEAARIDANAAPVELIAALLTAAGADPALVRSIASRISVTRRARTSQAAADPSLAPLSRPSGSDVFPSAAQSATDADIDAASDDIQAVGEISEHWGLPHDLADRVLPALTVANGTSQVDPTLAGRLVLSALLGGDHLRVGDYIARRSRGFADPQSAMLALPQASHGFVGFSPVSAIRALVNVRIANRLERRYEIVLAPPDAPGQQTKVTSWRRL